MNNRVKVGSNILFVLGDGQVRPAVVTLIEGEQKSIVTKNPDIAGKRGGTNITIEHPLINAVITLDGSDGFLQRHVGIDDNHVRSLYKQGGAMSFGSETTYHGFARGILYERTGKVPGTWHWGDFRDE